MVQAGTLDVAGTKEQRQRRVEQGQREEAAHLQQALETITSRTILLITTFSHTFSFGR